MCGTPSPASTGRVRPRIYCGEQCRWKAGHVAAAQAGLRAAEWAGWSFDDLLAWLDARRFEPL